MQAINLEECVQASQFFTQRVRVDVNKELSRARVRGTSERPVPAERWISSYSGTQLGVLAASDPNTQRGSSAAIRLAALAGEKAEPSAGIQLLLTAGVPPKISTLKTKTLMYLIIRPCAPLCCQGYLCCSEMAYLDGAHKKCKSCLQSRSK
jgi:hypothetical protein